MEFQVKNLRIGLGTDLHKLEDNGKDLLLGGVYVKHPKALGPKAHSDGDVLLHALIDAILGASGKDDIGSHFPDTDEMFLNCSSEILLQKTLETCRISLINVDVTIHCDLPKIDPYRKMIRENVSNLLGLPRELVNVKAKTFEKLPVFGKGNEAIFVLVSILGVKI